MENRNITLKIKNTARKVEKSCRLAPKSAFNTVIRNNASAGRNKQWTNIKDYFLADCDKAKVALISPNPDPNLQYQFNPEWSAEIAQEISSRTTPPPNPMGGKRKTRKGRKGRKGSKGSKGRKSRKSRR